MSRKKGSQRSRWVLAESVAMMPKLMSCADTAVAARARRTMRSRLSMGVLLVALSKMDRGSACKRKALLGRRRGGRLGICAAEELLRFASVQVVQKIVRETCRRAVVNDCAALQSDGTRAVATGDRDLMKAHHHRDAALPVERCEELHDASRGLRVQGGDRLVGKYYAGTLDQGTGQGGSLLLSAGQGRRALKSLRHEHDRGQRVDGGEMLIEGDWTQEHGGERYEGVKSFHHVVQDLYLANEVELLEDDSDLLAHPARIGTQIPISLQDAPVEFDRTGIGARQPGEDAYERGLAGSRSAQQGKHLARLYGKSYVTERKSLRGVALGDAGDSKGVHFNQR